MSDPYAFATPQEIERKRRMAQILMARGTSPAPVGHWTQALANVLGAGLGAYQNAQADTSEKQGQAQATQAAMSALQNMGPGASVDQKRQVIASLIQNPYTAEMGERLMSQFATQEEPDRWEDVTLPDGSKAQRSTKTGKLDIYQTPSAPKTTVFDERSQVADQMGLSGEQRNRFVAEGNYDLPQGPADKANATVAQGEALANALGYAVGSREWTYTRANGKPYPDPVESQEKAPAGYRFQGDGTLTPIAGGPATQLPAETGARVGMADTFFENLPSIKQGVANGDLTGPIDAMKAQQGIGQGGQLYRKLQSGADALLRMLTGSGMNQEEAKQYAARYLPSMRDTQESLTSKIDELSKELRAAKGGMLQGRTAAAAAPSANADTGGVVDYQSYFGTQ